jgi:outer membrane autotransporter protein
VKKNIHHQFKQKVLPLALTVALAAMAQAVTAQTVISTPTTGPYPWTSGDLSVSSSISGGTAGINATTSGGALTNSGSISGVGVDGVAGAAGATGAAANGGNGSHPGDGGPGGDAAADGTGGNGYGISNTGAIATLNNASGSTLSGVGGTGGPGGDGGHGGGAVGGNGGIGANGGNGGSGGNGGNGYGFGDTGTITTLNNTGTVSGAGGNGATGGTGGTGGGGGGGNPFGTGSGTSVNRSGDGAGGVGGVGGSGGGGGDGYGFSNAGTFTTLNNTATVRGIGGSGGSGGNGGTGGIGGAGSSSFAGGPGGAGGTGGNGGNGGNGYGFGNTGTLATLNNASGSTISGIGGSGGSDGLGGSGGAIGNSSTAAGGAGGSSGAGGNGGNGYGISNTSTVTIDSLDNGGTIIGTGGTGGTGSTAGADGIGFGIYNSGSIDLLTNSGLITGNGYAIFNDASGAIGAITNAGVIAGNITNLSSNDLTLNGGTGTTFGTLTGFGSVRTIGSITNTSSNVVLGTGNLLLNDNINVGSHAVDNNGTAVLQLRQPVTITGNYNQAGGTLQVGVFTGTAVGRDDVQGQLAVTGNTMMTSGSVSIVAADYELAMGQRYVVVKTAGTATYGSGLAYSAGSFGATGTTETSGTSTDLVVTVSPPATTASLIHATAPNAVGALTGLASYTGLDSGLMNLQNAMFALDEFGSSAASNHTGKQLAPISQASTAQAATAQTRDALNIISSHADALRLAQADGASGVSTGESGPAWGVWGQAFGGHASQDERDDVDGYSANFGGLLLGVDHPVNDAWRAGGVFSYSNAAINNTGDTAGDTTRVNSYGLMGYAIYTAPRWYANFSAGAVQQRYDTNRAVNLTGFSGDASGGFNGTQYVARAEAGYPLAVGVATVTPLASLTYSYLHQNAYTETGGDGAGLSVGAAHTTSVDSDFGVKIQRELSTSYGELVPELGLAWRHEYDNTRVQTAASFAADPTGQTSFTSLGASPVADEAVVSLGVTLLHANNLSVTARYELDAGSRYLAQGGSLRLRQLF